MAYHARRAMHGIAPGITKPGSWAAPQTAERLLAVLRPALGLLCLLGLVLAAGWQLQQQQQWAAPVSPAPPGDAMATIAEPVLSAPVRPDLKAIEREINRLGQQPPRVSDPIRAAYQDAPDLYGLMMDLLPLAAAGNGAAEYHIYRVLEECRAYLGPNGEATLEQTTLTPFWRDAQAGGATSAATDTERELWLREYHRCKNFVGASLVALELALGQELPGDITEYGAIWFERAFHAAYPRAQVDMVHRSSTINATTGLMILQQAAASGDEQVFQTLFEQAWDNADAESALAWLLVACRSGLDCRREAYWYQSTTCSAGARAGCDGEQSAIRHFWSALPASRRLSAYGMAAMIEADLAAGEFSRLPLTPSARPSGR